MSVTYPNGFRASAVTAGLKESGRPDLGLLVSDAPASAAGAFTTNTFPAAPVTLTKANIAAGSVRAVLVNSGQANAGTGMEGMGDAEAMAGAAAAAIDAQPSDVLICSTGVIGPRVPVGRVESALPSAVQELSPDGGLAFAEAILTTDGDPKIATADVGPHRVGGCVKGAGMIAPRLAAHQQLATLLGFITTDAPATADCLQGIVAERVVPVWNGLTIDGCQSTNDTVLLLASGAAGGAPVIPGTKEAHALGDAIHEVCADLARQTVGGAEGATKTLVVQVDGAAHHDDARRVGLAVAGSALVKTAVFGGDPNPGRLLQAVGDAGVALDPGRVTASLGDATVIEAGIVREAPDAKLALEGPEVVIRVDLGSGPGSATVFGCDLGYEYIDINARYTT